MTFRTDLIQGLEKYVNDAPIQFYCKKTIDRSQYIHLTSGLILLRENDFKTREDYKNFYRQYSINTEKNEIDDLFKDDNVDKLFLIKIKNHINWVISWLEQSHNNSN
ncbi:hypothetical protein [Flavobacterium sp. 1355]|uniref:hypothetical protein n=1 Tax=Flavobacterium sp. 1355 TaxID=2806571 RepID=UPI001AE39FD2|nr:hypothetical protein [Flavobacterium sp. 1355]MBP1222632.1 hypothetical protein [Flavobacterium sp. 1355]